MIEGHEDEDSQPAMPPDLPNLQAGTGPASTRNDSPSPDLARPPPACAEDVANSQMIDMSYMFQDEYPEIPELDITGTRPMAASDQGSSDCVISLTCLLTDLHAKFRHRAARMKEDHHGPEDVTFLVLTDHRAGKPVQSRIISQFNPAVFIHCWDLQREVGKAFSVDMRLNELKLAMQY